MTTRTEAHDSRLDRLRTPSGAFAMVALDQRESLREMFPRASDGSLVADTTLTQFKRAAARILSPHATGVLLDFPLGLDGPARPDFLAPGCGLVLAADILHSRPGQGVERSSLDGAVTTDLILGSRAAAVKYLVIWRRGDRSFVPDLQAFLALADDAGVASFVEGIVRPPLGRDWSSTTEEFDAIVEAAADLSEGATVYKAQVPGYRVGDLSAIAEQSQRVTDVVSGPWVVLSNGVRQSDFAGAVERAVDGGASGFLAGRAIWADTVSEPDYEAALNDRSIARLTALTAMVDRVRASSAKGVRS